MASNVVYEQVLPILSSGSPYTFQLNHAFEVGSEVTFVGIPHGDTFRIDLRSAASNQSGSKPTDIALHLSARFNDNTIVRNSCYNDTWVTEQRDGGMPLRPNQVFAIKIRSKKDGYKVYVNEVLFTFYKHPRFPTCITETAVSGDVTISNVTYQANMVGLGSSCSHAPVNIPMHHGFVPGTQINIQGIPQATKECFAIDLMSHTRGVENIVLHFKPIFKENVIVRNSLIDNVWGREERDNPMTVRPGNQVNISIRCESEGYKIYMNNSLFTFYKHRLPPHGVDKISISGGVIVNKVIT